MGSENEIKRLTFYIWGQWLIIISLLVYMYVIKSDIKNANKSIESIEKSIISQQESCNGVKIRNAIINGAEISIEVDEVFIWIQFKYGHEVQRYRFNINNSTMDLIGFISRMFEITDMKDERKVRSNHFKIYTIGNIIYKGWYETR